MESHHSHKVCAIECWTCSILVEDSVASVPIERGTDDPLISSQERHREEYPHFPVSLGEARSKYLSRRSARILDNSSPATNPSLPSMTATDPSSSSSSSSPSGKSSASTIGTCHVLNGKKGGKERCNAVLPH